MKTLSERLAEARKGAGLSQAALATLAGCGQSTIASIERGRNQGSTVLPRIADILGVSALWLAEGRGPRKPTERDTNHTDAGGVLLSLNSSREPDPPKYCPNEERTFFGGEVLARFARLTPEGQDLARTMLVAGIAEAERRHPVQANAS